ncbi:type II CAAX prenyl endopeptidase Rce1 family protein [Pseudoduganella sp.]|uniref:CPBP family glutamic-type intramembrane protease n=1 Tax=Pseudoduganella sp. TaxID=1880898 RepID=UPI0035B238D4
MTNERLLRQEDSNSINTRVLADSKNKSARKLLPYSIILGSACAIVGLTFSTIMEALFPAPDSPLAGEAIFKQDIFYVYFVASIWGPLYETLIAQAMPVYLTTRLTQNQSIALFMSATIFAVGHVMGGGGMIQMIVTFLYGLLFAHFYIKWKLDHGWKMATGAVALAHGINNTLILSAAKLS